MSRSFKILTKKHFAGKDLEAWKITTDWHFSDINVYFYGTNNSNPVKNHGFLKFYNISLDPMRWIIQTNHFSDLNESKFSSKSRNEFKCAMEDLNINHKSNNPSISRKNAQFPLYYSYFNTTSRDSICDTDVRIFNVAIALDCNYISMKGGSSNALAWVLKVWEKVAIIFRENFNIIIKIIDIRLFSLCYTQKDHENNNSIPSWNKKCHLEYKMSRMLSEFSLWRGSQDINAGLWHLMTGCHSKDTDGLSWLGSACVTSASIHQNGLWISGTSVSSALSHDETQVVAHELLHSFGIFFY